MKCRSSEHKIHTSLKLRMLNPGKKTKNPPKKPSLVLSWIQKREAAMKGRAASPSAERDQRAKEMNNECEKPRQNREDCL